MDLGKRVDRRTWLAAAGATAVGLSGVLLALGNRRRVGVVTRAEPQEQAVESRALRINLGFVSAYVVARGDRAAIVDTGVPNSADRNGEVLQAAGLGWDAVDEVILTHHHADHAGSAAEVLARAPIARLWVGELDMPQVRVPREILPARDGDEIAGLLVVHTPGHTAGHISLLDPSLGALFTGDAVVNQGGVLAPSPPRNSVNLEQVDASVRRIGSLTFEQVMFAHGEPMDTGGAEALRRLGETLA